jgi:hypothetical protein
MTAERYKAWRHNLINCRRDKVSVSVQALLSVIDELSAAEQKVERYEDALDLAIKKAAVEICNTYDVTTPRGKSFVNRPPVTISIIIQEQIRAALTDKEKA